MGKQQILVLLPVLAVVGCTAASPAPTTSDPVESPSTAASTVGACVQFSDVATLMHNTGIAHSQGRFSDQEVLGAQTLAARVLSRIATPPGEVGDIIAQAQAIASADPSAIWGLSLPDPEGWEGLVRDAQTACDAVQPGAFGVIGWTGG